MTGSIQNPATAIGAIAKNASGNQGDRGEVRSMSLLLKKKKILIVEDDPLTRFPVSDAFYICKTKCAVRTARNGIEPVQAHRDSAHDERRMKWIPIIF
jgi:hypothetical protein